MPSSEMPVLNAPRLTMNGDAGHREHQIVHHSYGRIRVHLPSWNCKGEADLEARLRQLTGVTRATANGLTGNILILFNPRETGPETLIPALLAMPFSETTVAAPVQKRVPAPLPPVRAAEAEPQPRPAATQYVTGVRRLLYRMLGWASVVMAIVGFILPGIPGAPFVILAGYFFIRSSPEAHQWLRESRWFGQILRDWEEHRGISRTTRNFAIGMILVAAVLCYLLGLPWPLLIFVWACQLGALMLVLSLRVVDGGSQELVPVPV